MTGSARGVMFLVCEQGRDDTFRLNVGGLASDGWRNVRAWWRLGRPALALASCVESLLYLLSAIAFVGLRALAERVVERAWRDVSEEESDWQCFEYNRLKGAGNSNA